MTFFNPTPGSHLSTLIQVSKIFEKKTTAAHEWNAEGFPSPTSQFQNKDSTKVSSQNFKIINNTVVEPTTITGSKPIQNTEIFSKTFLYENLPRRENQPRNTGSPREHEGIFFHIFRIHLSFRNPIERFKKCEIRYSVKDGENTWNTFLGC